MPDTDSRPKNIQAGAYISDWHGRLLLVRYRDEPHFWSSPRKTICFGSDPADTAVMAALLHTCSGVEILSMASPWYADLRIPEQGIHDIVIWYRCEFVVRAINVRHKIVLESKWVHPDSVLLHPLMVPTSLRSENLAYRELHSGVSA